MPSRLIAPSQPTLFTISPLNFVSFEMRLATTPLQTSMKLLCDCFTPPTGTWAGISTAALFSRSRRLCSRGSLTWPRRSLSMRFLSRVTSTTERFPRPRRCSSSATPLPNFERPELRWWQSQATTIPMCGCRSMTPC